MNLALNENNNRITALPYNRSAICPLCKEEVIAKCGDIKIWHWAHKKGNECDTFNEPETMWHINWKNKFPKEYQEFVIGCHRADIRTKDRWIIELQNSPISQWNILDRENYYKRMVWMLNGDTFGKNLILRNKKDNIFTFRWKNPPQSFWGAKKQIFIDFSDRIIELENKIKEYEKGKIDLINITEEFTNEYTGETYHYSSGKMDVTFENKKNCEKLLLCLENKPIFLIKKLYCKIPCGGYGVLISEKDFLKIVDKQEVGNGEKRDN